jgi:ferrous iron transport protein B
VSKPKTLTIALAGNPNCGKTTIFNNLTGSNQKIGNWPGVTVEKKEGQTSLGGQDLKIVDLPGIYGLSATSEDEMVSRNFLMDETPDAVINLVDATNLETQPLPFPADPRDEHPHCDDPDQDGPLRKGGWQNRP